MDETVDSYKGKGKAVALSSEESFSCSICSRTFLSRAALCIHQNSHRSVNKMSPILAALLNKRPPPQDDDKAEMVNRRVIIPVTRDPDDVPKQNPQKPPPKPPKRKTRKPRGGKRELIQDNFALIDGTGEDEKKKRKITRRGKKKKEEEEEQGEKLLESSEVQSGITTPQDTYYLNPSDDRVTVDLLREWNPMTAGFGSEICYSGTRYGCGSSSSGPVDLELRLGMGNR